MNELENLIEYLEDLNDQYNLDPNPKLGHMKAEVEMRVQVMEEQQSWYFTENVA